MVDAPERPTPPAPVRTSPVAVLRNTWRGLTSMRTALVLLFLLALAAMPGALLPQRSLNQRLVDQYFTDNPRSRRCWTGSGCSTCSPRPGSRRSTCC